MAERGLARPVSGQHVEDLVARCAEQIAEGLFVTVSLRLPTAYDEDAAEAATLAALHLVEALQQGGLARQAEVALDPAALGLALPVVGAKVGLENAGRIVRAARVAGTQVLLALDDHRVTEAGFEVLRELRKDFPEVGVGVAANLRRTEDDCRALAFEGSRVRLAKGARGAPATVAFADRHEADKSYVRCLKVLLAGQGLPVVATHDPRLVRIAGALATRFDRPRGSFEYQMRLGVRGDEQRRLHAAGDRVRVQLRFGTEPARTLVRRVAERGLDLTSFVRSLLPLR